MRVCCIPAGTGGVAFYRMLQPYGLLQKQGKSIFIYDVEKHDKQRLVQEQECADIIVFQCPWSEGILHAAELIKSKGKRKVVIEIDDNLFNVDPWNEKYNMFGLYNRHIIISAKEVETQKRFLDEVKQYDWIRKQYSRDGSLILDMWRDGYRDFNIEENKKKSLATKKLLNICDLVTVTTKELGKQLRKIAPKTRMAVLPNFIDLSRFLDVEKNETDMIRIGWQGGSAHFDDIRLIVNDLQRIYDKYSNVVFCFMGVQYDSILKQFGDRIEYYPWHGDIATYPLVVREMKLDIALAPLQDTNFNRGKSPLKWVEYSAMKIPSVVSKVVYNNYVDHNKTGLVADKDEWFENIERLILDKEIRKYIAEKAYDRVKFKFNSGTSILWWQALCDII